MIPTEITIITQTILDQIQALSNERQQLWRIAHRDKFSPAWWKRHNRIEAIGKQLVRLWHMRRVELAGYEAQQLTAIDRINADTFDDFRARVSFEPDGVWRIEDEADPDHRYMSVTAGFHDNQGHHSRNPKRKPSSKPNVGARQRQRAAQGMIQLS